MTGKEVPCPHGTSSENGLTPNCEGIFKFDDLVTINILLPNKLWRYVEILNLLQVFQ